jgi:hypothetical protein
MGSSVRSHLRSRTAGSWPPSRVVRPGPMRLGLTVHESITHVFICERYRYSFPAQGFGPRRACRTCRRCRRRRVGHRGARRARPLTIGRTVQQLRSCNTFGSARAAVVHLRRAPPTGRPPGRGTCRHDPGLTKDAVDDHRDVPVAAYHPPRSSSSEPAIDAEATARTVTPGLVLDTDSPDPGHKLCPADHRRT